MTSSSKTTSVCLSSGHRLLLVFSASILKPYSWLEWTSFKGPWLRVYQWQRSVVPGFDEIQLGPIEWSRQWNGLLKQLKLSKTTWWLFKVTRRVTHISSFHLRMSVLWRLILTCAMTSWLWHNHSESTALKLFVCVFPEKVFLVLIIKRIEFMKKTELSKKGA